MRQYFSFLLAVVLLVSCIGCRSGEEHYYVLQQHTAQIDKIEVIALVDMYSSDAARYVVLTEIDKEQYDRFIADLTSLPYHDIINPPRSAMGEFCLKIYYFDGTYEIVSADGSYDSARDSYDGWWYFDTTEFYAFLQSYGVDTE